MTNADLKFMTSVPNELHNIREHMEELNNTMHELGDIRAQLVELNKSLSMIAKILNERK